MNIISSTFSVQIYHYKHIYIILHHERTSATIPLTENNTHLRSGPRTDGNSSLHAQDARRANIAKCLRRDRQTEGRCRRRGGRHGENVFAKGTRTSSPPSLALSGTRGTFTLQASLSGHLGNVYRRRLPLLALPGEWNGEVEVVVVVEGPVSLLE